MTKAYDDSLQMTVTVEWTMADTQRCTLLRRRRRRLRWKRQSVANKWTDQPEAVVVVQKIVDHLL